MIIGPNGGGKTSLFRIIIGHLKASSGEIIKNPKLKIGYVPQKIRVPQIMPITARRFITLQANNKIYDKNFIKMQL